MDRMDEIDTLRLALAVEPDVISDLSLERIYECMVAYAQRPKAVDHQGTATPVYDRDWDLAETLSTTQSGSHSLIPAYIRMLQGPRSLSGDTVIDRAVPTDQVRVVQVLLQHHAIIYGSYLRDLICSYHSDFLDAVVPVLAWAPIKDYLTSIGAELRRYDGVYLVTLTSLRFLLRIIINPRPVAPGQIRTHSRLARIWYDCDMLCYDGVQLWSPVGEVEAVLECLKHRRAHQLIQPADTASQAVSDLYGRRLQARGFTLISSA